MGAFVGAEFFCFLQELGETNGSIGSQDQAGVPVPYEVGKVGLLGDDQRDTDSVARGSSVNPNAICFWKKQRACRCGCEWDALQFQVRSRLHSHVLVQPCWLRASVRLS